MKFNALQLKPLVLACALALPVLASLPAAAATAATATTTSTLKATTTVEGISEYRLANGMRVLLAPDASKPTTTVNVTYLVGSRHENYGETGMAHLLEHMVFKGTKTRGNIMEELSKRGMQFNGTTFFDRTNYFETFPANDSNLRWALEMEADRMVNSKVARVDLDKEFSVVRNEMEMGENNPMMVLWKELSAVSFDWHNYGKSTIGARSDVEGVKIENLQNFYRKYYQPDNAVLMVAGKFDTAATLALIEQTFGKIKKPARTLEPTWTREPERDGAREITVRRVGDQQIAAALYPVSAGSHADMAALSILSDILTATPNGRMYKQLVEGKLAVSVDTWGFDLAEPGYMMFVANLSKDQDLAKVKTVLLDQIENFSKQPVTEEEVKRAKTNFINQLEKVINDPQKLCVAMSESIAQGDWRLFFLARDRLEAVKPADVMRVAANYFTADNRSYGQFVPTEKPKRAAIPETPNVAKLVENYQGRAAVAAGEAFDVSPANIEKRTEKAQLANGAKLSLLAKKTRGETVNVRVQLHYGDEQSLFGKGVTPDLAADMLLRGADGLSRDQIDAKFSELKVKPQIQARGQGVTINFDTVRANLPAALDLLQKVLRKPSFPQSEFDLLVKENASQIEARMREPDAIAQEAVQALGNVNYKAGDIRYQLSSVDALTAYRAAKLADVQSFYQQFYGANNAEIAIVGDFDAAATKQQLGKLLGDWNSPAKYQRIPMLNQNPAPQAKNFETPDKANAFYFANLPFTLTDTAADYPALLLANRVFGQGPKSRLFERLRQKEGISYGAGSFVNVPALDSNASVGMYAIYAPQNLAKLKTGVAEELARINKDGVTAEELEIAKQAYAQEAQVGRAQDNRLVGTLASQRFIGRSMQFSAELDAKVAAVKLDEVNAAIRKYFKPEAFAHFYAGDFEAAAKKTAAK